MPRLPLRALFAPGSVRRLRVRLLLGLLRGLGWLAGAVPRQQALPLVRAGGRLWYRLAPAARAAVQANLRHVLRRAPPPSLVRAVFEAGALNYWDTFALPHLSREQILDLVDIDGVEHLDQALAGGHGAILASAHLGSISLVGQIVPMLGYPLTGLLEPIEPPELYAFITAQRQTFGARLLPVGPSAVRELIAALRRNEVVGLVTDRDVTGSGPSVALFGAPTSFPDGAAAIALRTGAPILPAVAMLRPDGRFVAVIEPPLPLPASGDRHQDVLALTQAVAGRLEYHIASHPEQWTVFQKRWPDA